MEPDAPVRHVYKCTLRVTHQYTLLVSRATRVRLQHLAISLASEYSRSRNMRSLVLLRPQRQERDAYAKLKPREMGPEAPLLPGLFD
jgi:hypothetical protein